MSFLNAFTMETQVCIVMVLVLLVVLLSGWIGWQMGWQRAIDYIEGLNFDHIITEPEGE
jgi:uncharacterized membrane protein affecting hemolysin expression